MSHHAGQAEGVTTAPIDPSARKKGRLVLVLLIAIFAAPLILARLWVPSGQVNNGTLIDPPVPTPDYSLVDAAGAPFSLTSLRHKWLLVVNVSASCDRNCEQNLYTIRQVRLAEGKHAPRLQSVLLTEQPLPEQQRKDYQEADSNLLILSLANVENNALPGLQQLATDANTPGVTAAQANRGIYVVDPLGNLMMYYNEGFEPKLIVKDLKRLLKASRVG